MTEFVENRNGPLLPTQKEEPKGTPERDPVIPLVDYPIGLHDDGSFTMCPEVMKIVRKAMLRRGINGVVFPEQVPFIEQLADAIYLHQGISFEQWT